MADNKITETIKLVAGEGEKPIEVGQPANTVCSFNRANSFGDAINCLCGGIFNDDSFRAVLFIFSHCFVGIFRIFDKTVGRANPSPV